MSDITNNQTDSALLFSFFRGNEFAFEALIHRHGGMVRGVCRRLLGQVQDAEDAAQAVFLILLGKAHRLRKRTSIVGWLHRVAMNVCRNAQRVAERRIRHEREIAQMTAREAHESRSWNALSPWLDRELDRLPEGLKTALLLHHVEGLTMVQVAEQLGWAEGTVGSRLHRARELLRKRISTRGIELRTGLLATLLADHAAAVPPLPASMAGLTRNGLQVATGRATLESVASSKVAALARGTLRSLHIKWCVKAVAVLLLAGLASAATGMAFEDAGVEPPPRTWSGERVAAAREPASNSPPSGVAAEDSRDPSPPRAPESRHDIATRMLPALCGLESSDEAGVTPGLATVLESQELPVSGVDVTEPIAGGAAPLRPLEFELREQQVSGSTPAPASAAKTPQDTPPPRPPKAKPRPRPARVKPRAKPVPEAKAAPPKVPQTPNRPPVRHKAERLGLFRHRRGTAVLRARGNQPSYGSSTYSFLHALRDDPGDKITHNDWELEHRSAKEDRFVVNMHGGDRSAIRDLGPGIWKDLDRGKLPSIAVPGSVKEVETGRFDFVKVMPGHMYLVRSILYEDWRDARGVPRSGKVHDFTTLIRVESHEQHKRVTITWEIVGDPWWEREYYDQLYRR